MGYLLFIGRSQNFIKEENMDTIVYDAVQDVKALAEYNGGGVLTPS